MDSQRHIKCKNFGIWRLVPNHLGTMKKLLKLRVLGQGMVRYAVGNGKSTWVWLDNWHPRGSHYKTLGEEVAYHLGQSLTAKVCSIIVNNCCRWPRPRNRIAQQIMANTPRTYWIGYYLSSLGDNYWQLVKYVKDEDPLLNLWSLQNVVGNFWAFPETCRLH